MYRERTQFPGNLGLVIFFGHSAMNRTWRSQAAAASRWSTLDGMGQFQASSGEVARTMVWSLLLRLTSLCFPGRGPQAKAPQCLG